MNYKAGDTITYELSNSTIRTVVVDARHEDVKNGRPGFSGKMIDPNPEYDWQADVWGYDEQIVETPSHEAPIDFNNFHDATAAIFQPCEAPDRKPDFVSESGSEYWDMGIGVIRRSDHWGCNIRSCWWALGNSQQVKMLAAFFLTLRAVSLYKSWLQARHPRKAAAFYNEMADPFTYSDSTRDFYRSQDRYEPVDGGWLRVPQTGFCGYIYFQKRG